MGEFDAALAQRVDLLGDICEEGGDEKGSREAGG